MLGIEASLHETNRGCTATRAGTKFEFVREVVTAFQENGAY